MGLFKKRGNEVPKLPELPPLPDLPEVSRKEIEEIESSEDTKNNQIIEPPQPTEHPLHSSNSLPNLPDLNEKELPEIPSHPLNTRHTQNEIKSTISPPRTQEIDEHQSFSQFKAIPPHLKIIKHIEKPRIHEPFKKSLTQNNEKHEENIQQNIKNSFEKSDKKPIFIRIDKFEKAIENFQTIKDQIKEMNSLLTEIKEKRAKEDTELNEWEHELDKIKAKIMSIDSALFEKVD